MSTGEETGVCLNSGIVNDKHVLLISNILIMWSFLTQKGRTCTMLLDDLKGQGE
jgi:hypothetical protein